MKKFFSILMAVLLVEIVISCDKQKEIPDANPLPKNLEKLRQNYLPIVDNLNALIGRASKAKSLESEYEKLKLYTDLAINSYEKASFYFSEACKIRDKAKIKTLVIIHKREVDNLLYWMKKLEETLGNIRL